MKDSLSHYISNNVKNMPVFAHNDNYKLKNKMSLFESNLFNEVHQSSYDSGYTQTKLDCLLLDFSEPDFKDRVSPEFTLDLDTMGKTGAEKI